MLNDNENFTLLKVLRRLFNTKEKNLLDNVTVSLSSKLNVGFKFHVPVCCACSYLRNGMQSRKLRYAIFFHYVKQNEQLSSRGPANDY